MAQNERNRQRPRRSPPRSSASEPSGNRSCRRKRRPTLLGVVLYVIFVLGVSGLLAGFGWMTANDMLALNKPEHSTVITIAEDEPFSQIVDTLKEAGIIEYKLPFRIFSLLSGAEKKVTPGSFVLTTEMDYSAIINNLSKRSSSRQQTTVTIPEGYTLAQIFQLLEDRGVSTVEKLNDKAANHNYAFSFLQEIPLGDPNRLEGYLFPDTYNFYLGEDPLYVINKMLVNFDAKLTEEMRQSIADSGRTIREIVIIASMIEKETDGEDQARISSVIYNRLNNPTAETAGFLNVDATIQYVLPAGQVVTKADYQLDSPYNTYLYKGLPPGPISNPGMVALHAAMNPSDTNYFFYALGKDGVHHFFSTYAKFQNFLASLNNG